MPLTTSQQFFFFCAFSFSLYLISGKLWLPKKFFMQPFEILLYTAPEGKTHIEVYFEDETFWLSQKRIAELFGVEVQTINYHLKEIFKTNELEEKATIRNFRIVQQEGTREVSRGIDFYNLDAIIAVGYRDHLEERSQRKSLKNRRVHRQELSVGK
jgi:hypothetical protein